MTPTTGARDSLFAPPPAQQEAHAAAELIAEAGGQVTLGGAELGGEIRELGRPELVARYPVKTSAGKGASRSAKSRP
ncbi:hypothetical protein A4R44_01093 [Amycolatopsis sp. M39]|nr:hypothetical protein A4R44_01093 [Amycolatopsis sp. M39]